MIAKETQRAGFWADIVFMPGFNIGEIS